MRPDISSSARAGWANQWDIYTYDNDDDDDDDDYDYLLDHRDPNSVVQTSVLSVCKVVKAEAIEVLYDTKILRGEPIDLDVMLESHDVYSRVRRIEITRVLNCTIRAFDRNRDDQARHSRHLRDLLERLQRLPRIHSILILSDCLTAETRFRMDSWVSVTNFVRGAGLGPATCVDIGRYQLHDKFKNVQIVNSELLRMWPAVRDTPEDYNGFEDAVAIIDGLGSSIDVPNVPAWASHTSLRCWVDIQQRFLALKASGEWNRLADKAFAGAFDDDDGYTDEEIKYDFFNRAAHKPARVSMDTYPLLESGEHALRLLRPNDDSDLLNEASQFLAVNIVLYKHYNDHSTVGPQWEMRPIKWKKEGDSINRTSLGCMAEQQSIALAGGASKDFVLDPSLEHDVPARNLIERGLFMEWIREFDHKSWTNGTFSTMASPTETKQLTHLHLAVLQPFSTDGANQHRRDNWAKGLMVRYMMASGRLRQDEVESTSISDLRTVMSIVLDVFDSDRYGDGHDWVKSFSSKAALPSDFDNDVYPGLGWRYGALLAQAFQRYTSQGRVSKTLARQWVKEGTMWG